MRIFSSRIIGAQEVKILEQDALIRYLQAEKYTLQARNMRLTRQLDDLRERIARDDEARLVRQAEIAGDVVRLVPKRGGV